MTVLERAAAACLFAAAAALAGPPPPATAQEGPADEREIPPDDPVRGSLDDPEAYPRPTARATRISAPVRVDGRLDEAAWASAEVLGDFVQSQPDPGRLATEPTEVRIVYDDEALYVGAHLFDSAPGDYVVQSLERDFPSLSTRDADIFGVTLDTFLDRRNSILVLVNPYGAWRDGQTFNDSRNSDFGFDMPVEVETAWLDDGWSLEMRIPWSALRYDAVDGEQAFGMNLLRRVRRKNEDSYWAPLERRDPAHRMSKAGTLGGFSDLPDAGRLWVKPYAVTDRLTGSGLEAEERGTGADVGFDVKYGLTPGLTLDATVNTDFSQVEVDQERVNLTRFPLRFEEQRDFFVENSGSFTFGDQTERNYRMGASLADFSLFHSRRIGLEDGRPVPILGGGRLSGRMGAWEVGLLDMRTRSLGDDVPAENFAVVRLRREVATGADVGAMLIDRSAVGGSDAPGNRSWGVDANATLLGALRINSYVAGTDSPDAEGDQRAWRLSAAWRDADWNVSALYRRIGDAFDPGVGFVRRQDVQHLYGTVGIHRRPALPGIQEVAPYVEAHHFTDLDGLLVTRSLNAGLGVDLVSGGSVTTKVSRRFERVEDPFEAGGGSVPPGTFEFTDGEVTFQSSAGRPLSASVTLGGGGYFNGDRRSFGTSFRWLASHRLAVQGSVDFNRIELPEGAFTSSVYAGRVKYGFSTRAFAALNVQYNDVLEHLVTYARFNVIHGPLSDLFLVVTERRQLGGGGGVLERAVTLKATKLLTF